MSLYNILMYPEHHQSTIRGQPTSKPPKFIEEVLSPPGPPASGPPDQYVVSVIIHEFLENRSHYITSSIIDKARCLLIDWDNGALLRVEPNPRALSIDDELAFRTVSMPKVLSEMVTNW